MKKFHIGYNGHSAEFFERTKAVRLLKSLEYNCHEVKCRNQHRCNRCHEIIGKLDTALSFYQRVDSHPYGHVKWHVCNRCYQVVENCEV